MKIKKLYIAAMLAIGFASCVNEESSIFDQSAAERLDAGQKEYFSTLCANGGKWVMEYFANTEEPGYVFVMEFHDDKSVDISTDHKWINNEFRTERSLWNVINDYGNVLTFNSYNTLFHIFSDPENIVGTDAPTDTNGNDVDEQGYGHNGDYEFLLIENTDGTIRLRGKKRGLYAYLRQLPESTDPETYLAAIAAKRAIFANKNFTTFVMTETATGAQYDITGLNTGVVTVMPTNTTNPYARTESKACIITPQGMRPYVAFDCIRENDSHFSIDEFTWASDGSLVASGVRLTAPVAATNLQRQDIKTWNMDEESMSPALLAALDAANAETVNISSSAAFIQVFGRNPVLKKFGIGYETVSGKILFCLKASCGNQPFYYYGTIEQLDNGNLKFEFDTPDDPLTMTILPVAPSTQTLLDMFSGEYTVANYSPMDPTIMKVTSVSNPDVYFDLQVN